MVSGSCEFADLEIVQRGPDYRLRFVITPEATGQPLATSTEINVVFSAEFTVFSDDGESGDQFGWAVDIDEVGGDPFVVVGAPAKHAVQPEVQFVRTGGDAPKPSDWATEVQVVGVECAHDVAEVQQFATATEPYGEVGGFFLRQHELLEEPQEP